MAWRSRGRSLRPEEVIDPFDAPDPVMPGGEPEGLPQDGSSDLAAEDMGAPVAFDPGVGSRVDSHEWHRERPAASGRPDRGAGAGPSAGHAPAPTPWQPPAQAGAPRTRTPTAPDAGARRPRRRGAGRIVGIFIAVVFAMQFVGIAGGCVSALLERVGAPGWDDAGHDYAYDYPSPLDDMEYSYDLEPVVTTLDPSLDPLTRRDQLEDVVRQEVEANLLDLQAAGDPYAGQAAHVFSDEFTATCDFEPSELGIDPMALAGELLPGTTYEISGASVFDGYVDDDDAISGYEVEATVYVDAEVPDFDSIAFDLALYVKYDLDLRAGDEPTDEQRRLVAEELDRLVDETEPRSRVAYVDLSGEVAPGHAEATLAMDEESWDGAVRILLGA